MKGEIIHIISDYRSGSTLLDQLLGAHPAICSIGELHHLRAYVLGDRNLHNPAYPLCCSCGNNVTECSFWHEIEKQLEMPLSSLRLSPRVLDHRPGGTGLKSYIRAKIRSRARSILASPRHRAVDVLFSVDQFIRDNYRLFDALLRQTGAEYVVDSSKALVRCRILQEAQPNRNRVILLCRDYRGVVHSKMNRGKELQASARSWAERVKRMDSLVADMPDDRVYRLRYEDLCTETDSAIQDVCRFLSLEYSPTMMTRPTDDIHQIGGSPSKFQTDRKRVKLDTAYENAFTPDELDLLRSIVGDTAKSWGYD